MHSHLSGPEPLIEHYRGSVLELGIVRERMPRDIPTRDRLLEHQLLILGGAAEAHVWWAIEVKAEVKALCHEFNSPTVGVVSAGHGKVRSAIEQRSWKP